MSSPDVTVVIPTYNRAPLLDRTLDSVLAQTFQNFEVLVVDDGSTDGTSALVAEYAARDARILYLAQPRNAGVSAARNRGLREAQGAFIAFLDSDDEWMPEKLARQVARFREVPETVGLIYTGVESVFEHGNRKVDRPRARGDLYDTLLLRNVIHGGGSNVMIRGHVLQRVGYFDEEIPAIEDWDYWLRIARYYAVDYVDAPLVRYHDVAGSVRKSLDVGDNMRARAWFYDKHSVGLRRAGVAHHFLLESARRHLAAPVPDVGQARRLAARALLSQPSARAAYPMFLRTVLPPRGFQWLRTIRHGFREEAGRPGGVEAAKVA